MTRIKCNTVMSSRKENDEEEVLNKEGATTVVKAQEPQNYEPSVHVRLLVQNFTYSKASNGLKRSFVSSFIMAVPS